VDQSQCVVVANRPRADVEGELLRMVDKTIYAAKVSTLAS